MKLTLMRVKYTEHNVKKYFGSLNLLSKPPLSIQIHKKNTK